MDCDAIRTPNFSAQVLRGLITSSIAFSVFDERFRFHFVNDALAKINRVPVKDHLGESVRKIAGDLALKAEPILESIFGTGKVVSGFEITGKLPKRPDVAHWVATYFPIRNEKRRIIQVGVLSAEIVSNGQLLERVSLNTKLLRQLLRRRGEHGLGREDAQRIFDGLGASSNHRAPYQELQSANLSEREREIISFLANGRSTKDIASTLGISVKTVESHRARIFFKLNLDSIASLVRFAIRTKMVEP
jgi:DNA-binding NarL/FixJ family response regulator